MSATNALKTTSKRVIQKTPEGTNDLVGNKIADVVTKSYDGRVTEISQTSERNNSETVTNEHDKETPKEIHISPKKRQKVTDDMRLI